MCACMYEQVSNARSKRCGQVIQLKNFLLLLLLLILPVLNVTVRQIVLNCTASLHLYIARGAVVSFLSFIFDVGKLLDILFVLLLQSTDELVSAVSSSLKLDGISIADLGEHSSVNKLLGTNSISSVASFYFFDSEFKRCC